MSQNASYVSSSYGPTYGINTHDDGDSGVRLVTAATNVLPANNQWLLNDERGSSAGGRGFNGQVLWTQQGGLYTLDQSQTS